MIKRKATNGVEYLTFSNLEDTGVVEHLFSTRLGGVSEGYLGTMNLSYARGDKTEHVDANYVKIGEVFGKQVEDFVFTDQTHTVNVRRVGRNDAGKRLDQEKAYRDVDGLITNQPGIVLTALFADCTPLYFVDPVNRAIGLAHAGWRGTVGKMAEHMIREMAIVYGSKAEEIMAAIGPCICQDCYEVGEELILQFEEMLEQITVPGKTSTELKGEVCRKKENGAYHLDISLANYYILQSIGVLSEHVECSNLCTCCHPEYLYSHRASHGKRGNLGAFMSLK